MLQRRREGYKSSSFLSRAGSNIFLPGTRKNNSACLELDGSREDNSSDNWFWRAKICPILSITNRAALWRKGEGEKRAACLSWTWILSSVIFKELLSKSTHVCREGSGAHLNNPSAHGPCLDLTWNGSVASWSGKLVERLFSDCWLTWEWWPQ